MADENPLNENKSFQGEGSQNSKSSQNVENHNPKQENKTSSKWTSKLDEWKSKNNVKHAANFFWRYTREIVSASLLLIGLVTSIYSFRWGSVLVACGFSLSFCGELKNWISLSREYFFKNGVFKNLMWFGLLLFGLFHIATFILSMFVILVVLAFFAEQNPKNN